MADRRPIPDDDDTMVCNGCSTVFRGHTARRHFLKHKKSCGGSVELRYGWTVRKIGAPQLAVAK